LCAVGGANASAALRRATIAIICFNILVVVYDCLKELETRVVFSPSFFSFSSLAFYFLGFSFSGVRTQTYVSDEQGQGRCPCFFSPRILKMTLKWHVIKKIIHTTWFLRLSSSHFISTRKTGLVAQTMHPRQC
jgi:hypothetical protein